LGVREDIQTIVAEFTRFHNMATATLSMMFGRRATGPAGELLVRFRRAPGFRGARIELRGHRSAARLIVGVGQMHPVLRGKFEAFQARKIANIQAWILHCCESLADDGVQAFGEEGFSSPQSGQMAFGMITPEHAEEIRRAVGRVHGPEAFLRDTAREWRSALRRRDPAAVSAAAARLNALVVLQAFRPEIPVFPIEQQDVHGAIGEGIRRVQDELEACTASPAYQSALAKGGRGLTREEYDAVEHRNGLVQAFNKILSHPERDRSMFREILRHAEGRPVTAFVLGQAHRPRMLRLAREHLDPDTVFAWVSPPQFWRWKHRCRTAIAFIVLCGVAAAIFLAR